MAFDQIWYLIFGFLVFNVNELLNLKETLDFAKEKIVQCHSVTSSTTGDISTLPQNKEEVDKWK